MFEIMKDFLKMKDVEYKENYIIRNHSSAKIGGKVKIFALPKSQKELAEIVEFADNNKIPAKIVGRMSNILFKSNEIDLLLISTVCISKVNISEDTLIAECGASLPALAHVARKSSLGGLESLSGIPSSLGGAICGNAGAFGSEMSNLVAFVNVFDRSDRKIKTLEGKECAFGYRTSVFKKERYLILSACLKLFRKNQEDIARDMQAGKQKRCDLQPMGYASLGSVFKRCGDLSAAKLIDGCGLKGLTLGDAQISQKHAGFIINLGNATASDFIALSEFAKKKVEEQFGVSLEYEIEII